MENTSRRDKPDAAKMTNVSNKEVEQNFDLPAAIACLGIKEAGVYVKEPDCHETLKDLIHYLRNDDEEFRVRKYIGSSKIIEGDLIPLLISYSNDESIFHSVLKLLVNLTIPIGVVLKAREQSSIQNIGNLKVTLLSNLRIGQKAFANEQLFRVLTEKLRPLIVLPWHERREDHNVLLQRVLTLVKQILFIPVSYDELQYSETYSTVDGISRCIELSGFSSVLLEIAQSKSNKDVHLVTFEIFYGLLNYQKSDVLAQTTAESANKNDLREQEMEQQKLRNQLQRDEARRHSLNSSYQRFASVYCVKGFKSLGGVNDAVSLKPSVNAFQLCQDDLKKSRAIPKRCRLVGDRHFSRWSPLAVRLFLKSLCERLLRDGFVNLMKGCEREISRNDSWPAVDLFHWAVSFFLGFSRHCPSSTFNWLSFISIATIHNVQTRLDNCLDFIKLHKTEAFKWMRRAHSALKAYSEILLTLWHVSQGSNGELSAEAADTLETLFRVVEYREFLPSLLRTYLPTLLSKEYLKDLVETTHFYLKIMEFFCNLHGGSLRVQRKVKRRSNKSVSKTNKTTKTTETNLSQWSKLEDELRPLLDSSALSLSEEELMQIEVDVRVAEESEVVECIRTALREGNCERALATLRKAKQLLPDSGVFKSSDDIVEILKELFTSNSCDLLKTVDEDELFIKEVDSEDSEGDLHTGVDHQSTLSTIKMVDFEFQTFLQKYANPLMIQWYVHLLKDFENNTTRLNYCIVKMLHRIAFDMSAEPLLYQASLFRVFQRLGAGRRSAKFQERYRDLIIFAGKLLKLFFKSLRENRKLYVEVLFWKSSRETYEIQYGYGSASIGQNIPKVSKRTIFDERVRLLYNQYFDAEKGFSDELISRIVEGVGNDVKRRNILSSLKRQSLVDSSLQKNRSPWSEDEIERLKSLYNEYNTHSDCYQLIANQLATKRSENQIVKQLKKLGFLLKSRGGKRASKVRSADLFEMSTLSDAEHSANIFFDDQNSPASSQSSVESLTDNEEDYTESKLSTVLNDLRDDGFIVRLKQLIDFVEGSLKNETSKSPKGQLELYFSTSELEETVQIQKFKTLLGCIGLAQSSNGQCHFWLVEDVDLLRKSIEKIHTFSKWHRNSSSALLSDQSVGNSPVKKRVKDVDSTLLNVDEIDNTIPKMVNFISDDDD